jgi:archaeal flagellar protein FlaH
MTLPMPEFDDEQPEKPAIITSGNPELDSKMGGGIPQGALTLIEGSSGSGKSVLAQQMIWGALKDGFHVALFTSENSVKSLIRQMQSIDLDVLDFLLLGKLRAYPVELAHLGDHASSELFHAMKRMRDFDVLIIDSFTSAITNSSTDMQIRRFFEGCKRLSGTGQTVIVTLHTHMVDDDLIDPVRSLCDAHLRLRTEVDGQRLIKLLEVAKVRGGAAVTGAIVGFDVEPGWGMRVIPISKARG